ncbi:hypothetical protein [Siphonobacter sp. SORGH_AS_1065]|uniref:hypothetical protein n=1 Tax=Siphonobacter sp. SORGH_AS_1065 TaxID=3041795 RepID=UPI00278B0BE2|nr:hypothetical protein [Siphonobacter sp. SORGH_AS_1065]MDQ1085739.1 hypothetical protein [Siphonobacter sp. SORGH_AS_1065]
MAGEDTQPRREIGVWAPPTFIPDIGNPGLSSGAIDIEPLRGYDSFSKPFPYLYRFFLPKPQTPNPKPQTPNPKPQTPNPKPQTPNPKPQTPNPKPQTVAKLE